MKNVIKFSSHGRIIHHTLNFIYPTTSIIRHMLNFIYHIHMIYTAFQIIIHVFFSSLSKIKKVKGNAVKQFIKIFSGQVLT